MLSSRVVWKSLPRVSSAIRSEPIHLSSIVHGEPKQLDPKATLLPKAIIKQNQQHDLSKVTLDHKEVIAPISGHPEEHVKGRLVRIRLVSKNPMQSGTDNTNQWQMDFETRERWENPLMGWSSTGDPLSNMDLRFNSKDAAISFCEKNGWECYVEEAKPKKPRVKNYGINFAWNKRTRASTK